MKDIIIFTLAITGFGIYLTIKGILGIRRKRAYIGIHPKKRMEVKGSNAVGLSIGFLIFGIFFLLGELIVIILALLKIIELN